jgi:histidinol-phosphate aminotransferase
MQPYVAGKPIEEVQREFGLDRIIKLASNENPLGPSPKAIAAVQAEAPSMHLYPDACAHDLREAIALRYGVEPGQVIVGNGSDEIIHMLGMIFLSGPEDSVMVGYPSFVRYDAAAQLAESQLVRVPLDFDLRHDLDAMAKAVTSRTKLIFIANPNNPTGTVVGRAELNQFLDQIPESVVVVLDEAYFEFADGPDFPSSLDYVRDRVNVIGLRTFSKTYGLAGIRIGFGFASAAVVDALNRAREPFNANRLAQVAAIAALSDQDHLRATVENNRRGIETISQALESIGAKVYPSQANFVLADLHRPAAPLFDALLREGIIIRNGAGLGMPTCVRVSIGTAQENEAFAETLARVSLPVS